MIAATTKKAIAKLVKALEKEHAIIAKSRDRIRELIHDARGIECDLDEGIDDLDRAADALSRLQ